MCKKTEKKKRCVFCGTNVSDFVAIDRDYPISNEYGETVGYTQMPDEYMCINHASEYQLLSNKFRSGLPNVEHGQSMYTLSGYKIENPNDYFDGHSRTQAFLKLFVDYLPLQHANLSNDITENE